ncbi:MAG: hypothetical protein GKR94_05275 [Gammaproteobacteria bacterium]|nr:hypothetical protein [Gammaproteobacteria bacterium]
MPGDEHRSTHPRTGNARDERCQPGLEPVRSGRRGALAVRFAVREGVSAVERQNRPVHTQVQHFEPKRCMQATLPVRMPSRWRTPAPLNRAADSARGHHAEEPLRRRREQPAKRPGQRHPPLAIRRTWQHVVHPVRAAPGHAPCR